MTNLGLEEDCSGTNEIAVIVSLLHRRHGLALHHGGRREVNNDEKVKVSERCWSIEVDYERKARVDVGLEAYLRGWRKRSALQRTGLGENEWKFFR